MQKNLPNSRSNKTRQEKSEGISGSSGSDSTNLLCEELPHLTDRQREHVRAFENLAKAAAKKIKDKLTTKFTLSDMDKEHVDELALDLLIRKAATTTDEQLVAGFFNECFENFVKWETPRIEERLRNRHGSLTRKDGTTKTDIIDYKAWGYGDIIEFVGCPHADIVRRHYLDGEKLNEVLKTREERAYWYRVQKPEVINYLKKLYDR